MKCTKCGWEVTIFEGDIYSDTLPRAVKNILLVECGCRSLMIVGNKPVAWEHELQIFKSPPEMRLAEHEVC